MPKKINLHGFKFNRLTAIKENGITNDGKIKWLCICDCGKITSVSGSELRNGGTKSCGCISRELLIKRNTTHGLSKTAEYCIWKGIKRRCFVKKSKYYFYYGGRGISMSNEWVDSFNVFLSDMGNRPSKLYSVERRDNNGNYEKSNCYWATKHEQSYNKRNNRIIEFNGKKFILKEWADYFKIPVSTLHSALKVNSFSDIYIKWNKSL